MKESRVNKKINVLKAMAIISVVCAHCNAVGEGASYANQCVHFLLNAIGTVGVGIFFVVSGWLFIKYTNKESGIKKIIINKAKRLLIPWLICGTIVYLYVVLRKGGLSLITWFNYLIGKGSYLYFVPVLFVLYLIGYCIHKSRALLLCGILLSIVSNILTYVNLFDEKYAVLNAMNWLVYFAFGMYLAKLELKRNRVFEYACVIITIMLVAVVAIKNVYLSYWTPGFLVFEVTAGMTLYVIADVLSRHCVKLASIFEYVGKDTMAIYLLHMPIAGIVANLCGRFDIWMLTLMRPAIVLVVTVSALWLYKKVVKKFMDKTWPLHFVGLQ